MGGQTKRTDGLDLFFFLILVIITSAGDNDQRSKRFCSIDISHVTDGLNTRDQITRGIRSRCS